MTNYKLDRKEIQRNMTRIGNIVGKADSITNERILYLPGMAATDFTRTGVPTAMSVAMLIEYARLVSWKKDDFIYFKHLIRGCTQVVVIAQSMQVSQYFHQRARLIFPMILRFHLVYVGNSSYSIDITIRDQETGDLLISGKRTFALMDPASSQSVPIPEDARKEMESVMFKSQENRKIEILRDFPYRPTSNFKYFIHVRHSDSDQLYHTNQAAYFRFLMDAATEGVRQGYFKHFFGDLLSYRIKSLDCKYKGESFPGDVLEVIVWEDDRNAEKLFGQIEKDGTEIWMGTISFYLPVSLKKIAKL